MKLDPKLKAFLPWWGFGAIIPAIIVVGKPRGIEGIGELFQMMLLVLAGGALLGGVAMLIFRRSPPSCPNCGDLKLGKHCARCGVA
jgi:hypothetical protein